ncbi:MAG: hypothetical protein Q7K42_02565, partial [Candidatus Diapherotrites archaeon]|nr:hypothetical protein [Candidatus Diapherotrites archaeon]
IWQKDPEFIKDARRLMNYHSGIKIKELKLSVLSQKYKNPKMVETIQENDKAKANGIKTWGLKV